MRIIADLHLHSKYSRATSPDLEVVTVSRWARRKGIQLMGTGDFTHPTYLAYLKGELVPTGNGLFSAKRGAPEVSFMLTVETSNIFRQGGRLRKVHTVLLAPSFEVVDRLNARLARRGKLSADGRATFTFPVKDLVKLVLDTSPDCLLIPAHAWTPWFSLFGANSGFDSLEECFEEEAGHLYAIETGLSSDPAMNWRLSALDRLTLLSNSDAHSPSRIGREACVFEAELDYGQITGAIKQRGPGRLLFTIEFFPEEGKYHFDGHRSCGVSLEPGETRRMGRRCPRCQRPLTIGVLHRVESLADRPKGYVLENAPRPRHLVPLQEILAEVLGAAPDTKGVLRAYEALTAAGGSEFQILLDLPEEEIFRIAEPRVAEAILRVRQGRVQIEPGYDGVYGRVQIFGESKEEQEAGVRGQMALF